MLTPKENNMISKLASEMILLRNNLHSFVIKSDSLDKPILEDIVKATRLIQESSEILTKIYVRETGYQYNTKPATHY